MCPQGPPAQPRRGWGPAMSPSPSCSGAVSGCLVWGAGVGDAVGLLLLAGGSGTPPAAPLCRGTPEMSRSPAINTADEGRGGWHEPRHTAAEAQHGARPGLQGGCTEPPVHAELPQHQPHVLLPTSPSSALAALGGSLPPVPVPSPCRASRLCEIPPNSFTVWPAPASVGALLFSCVTLEHKQLCSSSPSR